MLCVKRTAENFLLSRRLLSICDVRQVQDYLAKLSGRRIRGPNRKRKNYAAAERLI